MSRQNIPTQPKVLTTHYSNLLGVDYQSDATEVGNRRSPEMVNMISDIGGNPIKRYGYRNIGVPYAGFVSVYGDDWAVRTSGSSIYAVKISIDQYGEITETVTKSIGLHSTHGTVKHIFSFQDCIYVLCENEWIEYDTTADTIASLGVNEQALYNYEASNRIALYRPDDRFIPTITTMLKPNGGEMAALPEGTDITGATEGVNILTPFRRVEYLVDTETADETTFVIPSWAKVSPNIKVEVLDSATFEWKTVSTFTKTGQTLYGCRLPDDSGNTTTYAVDAKIVFNTAPYIAVTVDDVKYLRFRDAQTVDVPIGVPNVRITFAPFNMNVFAIGDATIYRGYYNEGRNKVLASNAVELYDSRLFAANGIHTYYSRASLPFNIDDNFYFDVDKDVVAYAKSSSYLAVISEDTGKDSIYIAKGEYNESYAMTTYSVKASSAGIGAVAAKSLSPLNDEPIFLSHTGLYGLSTNYLSEKYAIMRSGKINRRLCKEPNLENAVGVTYNGYYYLAINNQMYILDGRHKDASRNGDNSYECYYFDNMPSITDMFVVSNRMYFTDGTNTYTWNDDIEPQYQYLDNAVMDAETYVWSGEPVKAKWCSSADADGAPQYYKILTKKGTLATIAPPMQTSCQITIIKDQHDQYYIGRFNGGTFALSDGVLDAFTKKKIKKYKRLQFVVENNEPEPFGLISITKSYTIGNYAKR